VLVARDVVLPAEPSAEPSLELGMAGGQLLCRWCHDPLMHKNDGSWWHRSGGELCDLELVSAIADRRRRGRWWRLGR